VFERCGVEKLLETAAADSSDMPDKNDVIIKTKATIAIDFYAFIRISVIVTASIALYRICDTI